MSYIGSTPTTQSFIAGTDYFNGTGSQVAFTLSRSVNSVNDIEVIVNNVEQIPSGYLVSGTTLTFSAAPSAGTSNVYVRYLSTTNLSLAIPAGTSASFNTVTATSLTATNLTTTNGASIQGLTVGRGAGAVATNTAVGAGALAANTSGDTNTATGYQALTTNTSGTSNTAVGYQAAYLNSTGTQITVLGIQAGYSNTTGSYNTAIGGWDAGGWPTLYTNTTGNYNVALGNGALAKNTTASNNTAVGYQAGYTNTTGTFSTYLGYQSGLNSNYTSGVTGNTFVGAAAGFAVTTGRFNTFIGVPSGNGAGGLVTTGSNNTIIGAFDGNQGGLDIRTASNYIVLSDGSGNPRAYFNSSGIFINPPTYSNTTASAANLVMGPTGTFERSTSALKYKQDIRDLESMDISLLRPVRYKSKCVGDDQTKDHFGVVADEAAEAGFEELISRGADGEVEGFQYERLTVVLLKELQMLRARVAQLESNP